MHHVVKTFCDFPNEKTPVRQKATHWESVGPRNVRSLQPCVERSLGEKRAQVTCAAPEGRSMDIGVAPVRAILPQCALAFSPQGLMVIVGAPSEQDAAETVQLHCAAMRIKFRRPHPQPQSSLLRISISPDVSSRVPAQENLAEEKLLPLQFPRRPAHSLINEKQVSLLRISALTQVHQGNQVDNSVGCGKMILMQGAACIGTWQGRHLTARSSAMVRKLPDFNSNSRTLRGGPRQKVGDKKKLPSCDN